MSPVLWKGGVLCGARVMTSGKAVTCTLCSKTLGIRLVKHTHWHIAPHRGFQNCGRLRFTRRFAFCCCIGCTNCPEVRSQPTAKISLNYLSGSSFIFTFAFATAGFCVLMAGGVARNDFEPESPPQRIPLPVGTRLQREFDHSLHTMPCTLSSLNNMEDGCAPVSNYYGTGI